MKDTCFFGFLLRAIGKVTLDTIDFGVALRLRRDGLLGSLGFSRLHVERLESHLGNLLLDELFDVAHRALCLRRHKCDGETLFTRTPCTPYAMDVIFSLLGHIVIDDVIDLVDIYATCENIGCRDDPDFARRELVECTTALRLAAIGMDGFGDIARFSKATARGIGTAARPREHDDPERALLRQNRLDERRLDRLRAANHVLIDRLSHIAPACNFHRSGIAQHRADDLGDRSVYRRREQQRLTGLGSCCHDFLDGRKKAHIEHAVGFVEHEHFDVGEFDRLLVHKVNQPARRGDEHVTSALQALDLRIVRKAADDGRDAMMGRHCHLGGYVTNLLRKFAGGSHDEHERALPVFCVLELVHRRKRERRRLASARLRCCDDIATFQHKRNS